MFYWVKTENLPHLSTSLVAHGVESPPTSSDLLLQLVPKPFADPFLTGSHGVVE